MNYGKYKYELEKKAKEAKKKQHVVDVKEIKVRYKIDTHDYEVRLKNIRKFISQGNKVKIVVMLRGREKLWQSPQRFRNPCLPAAKVLSP